MNAMAVIAGRRARRRRGQTLVEFAITFPVLMLIIFGLFDVGRAVFVYNTITNAAREGARLAIVNQDTTRITQRAHNLAPTADRGAGSVVIYFSKSASVATANDCTPLTIGCNATVRYVTTFRPITPVIGTIVGSMTLTAQSVFPIEFVCPNTLVAAAACPKQP